MKNVKRKVKHAARENARSNFTHKVSPRGRRVEEKHVGGRMWLRWRSEYGSFATTINFPLPRAFGGELLRYSSTHRACSLGPTLCFSSKAGFAWQPSIPSPA